MCTMGECNENIENLLKIVEKRKKKSLKKQTPPGRRALYKYVPIFFRVLLASEAVRSKSSSVFDMPAAA